MTLVWIESIIWLKENRKVDTEMWDNEHNGETHVTLDLFTERCQASITECMQSA